MTRLYFEGNVWMKLHKCNGTSLTAEQVFEKLQDRYPMIPTCDDDGENQRVLLMAAYIEYHQPPPDAPLQTWVDRHLAYFAENGELPFYSVRVASNHHAGEIKEITLPASVA